MKLTGNTILITGGSSGIGFEMARQFLQQGNKVVITGRDENKLHDAKRQLDGLALIRSDVSKPDDVTELHRQVASDFPRFEYADQ